MRNMREVFRKAKQRVLPPSSRSFHNASDEIVRHLDIVEQKLRDIDVAASRKEIRGKATPYVKGERVRVAFLFQVPSFWPNWESLYAACIQDSDMDVRMVLLEETVMEQSQMKGARRFLVEKGIDFAEYDEVCLYRWKPHVLVVQTPYDFGHRSAGHWTKNFVRLGMRIVYVPYGVEISNTEHARSAHFHDAVLNNAWRIYTFSERMMIDYILFSSNGDAVRALGHPRFDWTAEKERFKLAPEIKQKAKDRPIVLWHLHFSKKILDQESFVHCTPYLNEYFDFLRYIPQRSDLFFLMLPHPKFCEDKQGEKLIQRAQSIENVFVDWACDYRNSLLNANYMITDRSALMIDIALLNIPVLYLCNADFCEPLTQAIQPIIDSYDQGFGCADMMRFIEQSSAGKDQRRDERIQAVSKALSLADGRAGMRIKDDIKVSVIESCKE